MVEGESRSVSGVRGWLFVRLRIRVRVDLDRKVVLLM